MDREFFLLFSTFDENRSWYLDDNINKYYSDPGPIDQLKSDAGFKESNQNYAINGFLYGNLPGLKMYSGEKVEWYLMGLGDLTDVHTVHFHGQSFVYVRVITSMITLTISYWPHNSSLLYVLIIYYSLLFVLILSYCSRDLLFIILPISKDVFGPINTVCTSKRRQSIIFKHTVHEIFRILFLSQKSTTIHRDDVYDLFPGIYATVEMVPDSVGNWLLHCHVNNHLSGGMQTLFSVMTPTSKPILLETCFASLFNLNSEFCEIILNYFVLSLPFSFHFLFFCHRRRYCRGRCCFCLC